MNFLDILYGTPWWVFVILIQLIVVGIKSRSTHHISVARMSIIPIILIIWSIYSINDTSGLTPASLATWLGFFILSSIIGWKFLSSGVSYNKSARIVTLQGNNYTLPLLIGFFLIKYCIGVIHAINPVLAHNTLIWLLDVATSGCISGLFTGRLIHVTKYYL